MDNRLASASQPGSLKVSIRDCGLVINKFGARRGWRRRMCCCCCCSTPPDKLTWIFHSGELPQGLSLSSQSVGWWCCWVGITSSLNWYSAKSVLLGGTERVIRLKFTKLQSNDFSSFVCNLFSIEFFSLYFVTDKMQSSCFMGINKTLQTLSGRKLFSEVRQSFLEYFCGKL